MALTKVVTNAITDDAVTAAKIADGTIVAADLAANSVDSAAYVDGSIDLAHMSVNSIDSDQYVDGSIDNAHIADDAIDSEHYADGSIDNAHIADDAIDSEHYADGSIDTAHIANDQITAALIADNAIDSDMYVDASIDTAHIGNLQVTTGLIAADAITAAKIADNAIDSEHYTDGSIDNAHIADDAIDSEHYADGSIDNAHIADDQIGSEHYAAGSVDTTALGADAVTAAKIADDVVNSEHYAAASIDNEHLADNAVDSAELAAGSVDTAHIADNQVTLAKMAGIARGKIIYGDASGDPAVLTAGSNGQVLKSDGTDISWGTDSGGAALTGSTNNTVVTVTGSDAIAGEANLTFDGSTLGVIGTAGFISAKDLGTGIHIRHSDSGFSSSTNTSYDSLVIEKNGSSGIQFLGSTSATQQLRFGDAGSDSIGIISYHHSADRMAFWAGANEVVSLLSTSVVINEDSDDVDFRVETNGQTHGMFVNGGDDSISFGNATKGSAYEGMHLKVVSGGNGTMAVVRDAGTPMEICRNTNDGTLCDLRQAGTAEGFISVDGSTVSFTTFMGSHWSQLADNSKPTILRGTVMETIADMSLWYSVKFNVAEEGQPVRYHNQEYDKPDNENVGDTVAYTYEGKDFTAEIVTETNYTLPKCKVSDTADSKAVYGVFHCWDDGDGDNYMNDMNVASLGTYMIRVHKDETVAIGDYLVSNGDGTAKVQADDILRASTIGKVTTTEKVITHGDSSYCVPCTLHCG